MGRSMPSEGTTTRVGRASPVVVGMRVGSAVGWAVGEGDVPGIGLKYGSVGGVQIGYEGVGAPLPMGVGVAHGGGVTSKTGSPGSGVGVNWATRPAACGGAQLKTPTL